MIELPRITSPKGSLTVCDVGSLPFTPVRAYWIYDVPDGAGRGGHAHRKLTQAIFCLAGGFLLNVEDRGSGSATSHYMKYPWEGILIPPGAWRDMWNFAPGTVALVFADRPYEEDDYIRSYSEFRA